MFRAPLVVVAGAFALGVNAVAVAQVELASTTMVVRAPHVELLESWRSAPALQAAPSSTPMGLAWSHGDGGAGWIGAAVSLGQRGTQVFTEYAKNAQAAALLSAFDLDPPQPLWARAAPATEAHECRSAESADLHAVLHEVNLGAARRVELCLYGSSSPTPLWSYAFPGSYPGGSDAGMSSDGARIVAAASDDANGEVDLASFGPGSAVPLASASIAVAGPLRGFDLSADGSTLLFTAGGRAYLLDAATLAVLDDLAVGTFLDAASISGDGRVFAVGAYNWLRVYERSGAGWAPTGTRALAGSNFVGALDVSADGSTVAYAFTFYDTFLSVRAEALDVPSKLVTMSELFTGSGALQNVAADVAVCADGSRFALGVWGDAAGSVPELRIYARDQSAPLAALDLPGSVFDVAISADGRRVAAAAKAVHANTLGNGGSVVLWDAGGADLTLSGSPRVGTSPRLELHAPPGRHAFLLMAGALAALPVPFAASSTLYLDRDLVSARFLGNVPASGVLQRGFTLPSDPQFVGATVYVQGRTSFPVELTDSWLALTLLP